MLTAREYEDILFFLTSIQNENNMNFRIMVLKLLNEVFGYPHLTFHLSNEKGMLVNPITFNLSDDFINAYEKYYFQTDIFNPINDHQKLLLQKNAITITDLMSYKQFEQTVYYNDLFRKYNFYYEIALPLKVEDKIIGGIGIVRSPQQGEFTKKDKMILDRLNKYISTNLRNHLHKLRLENEKQVIVNSIEQLSVGLIILDGKFSLLHSNKTAQEYCMDIANKSCSNSLIHVINLLSLEFYGKSLRTTFDIKSYTFNITSILVPSEGMGIESVYCVYIVNQQDDEDSSIDVDESLYTLTHREKEIIVLMAKGYSDKDIAKSLYLSTHTVRTHFKNIFRKMDASSRTEVLYKLNNIRQKKLFISSSK